MKIAFVSQGFGRVTLDEAHGSIAIWIFHLMHELSKNYNCSIVVYELDEHALKKRSIKRKKIEFILIPTFLNKFLNRIHNKCQKLKHSLLSGKKRSEFFQFASSLFNFLFIFQVALDLRKRRCDIVHIMNFSQFIPVVRFFNPNINIVLNMRCEWLSQLNPVLVKKRIKKSDMIIGISDFITNETKVAFPEFLEKCVTVQNGIDLQESNASKNKKDRPFKILFVGRVSPEKGLHVLIEAFKLLVKQNPNILLEIVGPTNSIVPKEFIVSLSNEPHVKELEKFYSDPVPGKGYFEYLQSLTKDVECSESINFVGRVPHESIAEYYEGADVVVNPSYSESFGRSLIEAMSFGVPVIATRIGGMANIIRNEENGLLIEVAKPTDLVNALKEVITNLSLREKLAMNGLKTVREEYSWPKVASELFSNYQKLLS